MHSIHRNLCEWGRPRLDDFRPREFHTQKPQRDLRPKSKSQILWAPPTLSDPSARHELRGRSKISFEHNFSIAGYTHTYEPLAAGENAFRLHIVELRRILGFRATAIHRWIGENSLKQNMRRKYFVVIENYGVYSWVWACEEEMIRRICYRTKLYINWKKRS